MGDLPFGAFFVLLAGDGRPWVQLDDGAAAWSHAGYATWTRWPDSLEVELLTPPATLAALRGGYRPFLHPSADAVRASCLSLLGDGGRC